MQHKKFFKKYTFGILILKLAEFQCKIQYTKTEENLMQRERRKREKIRQFEGSTTKSGNVRTKHKHADDNNSMW